MPRQGGAILLPPVLTGLNPEAYRDRVRAADEAFGAGRWPEAAKLYQEVVSAYPYDSRTWSRLAASNTRLGRHLAAATAHARAHGIGVPSYPERHAAEAARSYARALQPGVAIKWLRTALEDRYLDPQSLVAEPVFDPIRSDPEFKAFAATRQPRPASTRLEQWEADLDFLVEEVKRVKLEPRAGREKAERFLAAAAALRPRLAALSDSQAVVEMQKLMALFQEGHNTARFIYGPETTGKETFKQIPITFYIFPSGVYVIGADTAHSDLIGARVERFGTISADEAVKRVGAVIDRDTDMAVFWLGPTLLSRSTVLHAIGGSDSPDRAKLLVRLRKGALKEVSIAGGAVQPRAKLFASRTSSNPVPLYLQRVSTAFWLADIDRDTSYFQFNQVTRRTSEGDTIEAFADRLLAHLEEKKPKTLIVDMRHNNGGDTYTYHRLLRTLIAYDMQPKTQLYVITGRSVYSAAINFAVEMDRLTDALFAGEPMGGMPLAGGDPLDLPLPYSNATMGIATSQWALQSPWDTRAWVMVDLPVTFTAIDYFENRDPVLDAVLKDAERLQQ
jgi:tetratricopeptide (TPR) repeat protein